MAEVLQDDGHVDALAAGQNLLVVHAVDSAGSELVQADDVVQRWVECYGVNHEL